MNQRAHDNDNNLQNLLLGKKDLFKGKGHGLSKLA
jgi:hypothetical protein